MITDATFQLHYFRYFATCRHCCYGYLLPPLPVSRLAFQMIFTFRRLFAMPDAAAIDADFTDAMLAAAILLR